jgi:hypothetical protein
MGSITVLFHNTIRGVGAAMVPEQRIPGWVGPAFYTGRTNLQCFEELWVLLRNL